MNVIFALILLAQATPHPPTERPKPFTITVVDDQTGRGIPLVELKTIHHIAYVTDSAGVAAIEEPGLDAETVYFHVEAFGYSHPADRMGSRGTAFKIVPGAEAKISLHRENLAERLYRVTGAGIYRDSELSGKPAPIAHSLMNSKVFGQDSVNAAVFNGKIYWFWGDTRKPGYPYGNNDVAGAATSLLPNRGGLYPDVGIDLTYFLDPSGHAKATCRMPGDGSTWISGLTVVRGSSGREQMFAKYEKTRMLPDLRRGYRGQYFAQTYEHGMVEFDEAKQEFHKVFEISREAPVSPFGHSFSHTVAGIEHVYYGSPFPLVRVRAQPETVLDLSKYESFTPLAPGSSHGSNHVERDAAGKIVWGWKANTAPAGAAAVSDLISHNRMKRDESLVSVRDVNTDLPIIPSSGSVHWNAHRNRWVMIFTQDGGDSPLGEVWYAEADSPVGPWVYARKIVTHHSRSGTYSFYNPIQHEMFDQDGGRTIFFEGTYAAAFSTSASPTPRYDYNQIMYKLDLEHPDLPLPVPVYELSERGLAGSLGTATPDHPERRGHPIAFFALDRPTRDSVPVTEAVTSNGNRTLILGKGPGAPLFHILPQNAKALPTSSMPLLEYVHDDGLKHSYTTDMFWNAPGYRRSGRVLGYVWASPLKITVPRD